MTTYADYPDVFLPLPAADFNAKLVTNTATTGFASGRVRRRRLGWGKVYSAKLNWELSPEEYDFFMGWWEYTLRLGTVPFVVVMATGALTGEHRVQLTDDPDSTHLGYFWKVSCEAMILDKPALTEEQVRIMEGGSTLATFPVQEDLLDAIMNINLPSHM